MPGETRPIQNLRVLQFGGDLRGDVADDAITCLAVNSAPELLPTNFHARIF